MSIEAHVLLTTLRTRLECLEADALASIARVQFREDFIVTTHVDMCLERYQRFAGGSAALSLLVGDFAETGLLSTSVDIEFFGLHKAACDRVFQAAQARWKELLGLENKAEASEGEGQEQVQEQTELFPAGPANLAAAPTNRNEIVTVLMERDGLTETEAKAQLEDLRQRIREGEDPEELLHEELGLEPDYFFDLIEGIDLVEGA